MAAPPPPPEETPKTNGSNDEDTFLFMGKRIPLTSAPGQKSKSPGAAQQPPPGGQTVASKHEPIDSAKSSFDLEPLAQSSKSSSSSRIFLLGGGLLLIALALMFLWHRFGSTEARMFERAKEGQLVAPPGESAFDLYHRLKAGGISPVTRERLKNDVLPKLSEAGEALLKKVYDGVDLTDSEQEQLIRLYEFAADVDAQNNALLARRAYGSAYRASLKKADAQALPLLREAFQSDSQWSMPFRDVARVYARAGNYANAEYFYQQTLQLNPKWILPALELGKLAMAHDRLAEAEIAFRRAMAMDPSLPGPWVQLGSLCELQKKNVEAVAAYEKALQLAEQQSSPQVEEIRNRLRKLK